MQIIQCNGTTNTSAYSNRPIKYIVIHYVACTHSERGVARNVAAMFKNGGVRGSADFIVDDAEMVQYNGNIKNRYCWSVGGSKYSYMSSSEGGKYYNKCTNINSISIEVCNCKTNKSNLNGDATDWYFTDAAIKNAADLTKYLMAAYNIPAENVIMHHHVTGKVCPNPWCVNESRLSGWKAFKAMIATNTSSPAIKDGVADTTAKIAINAKIKTYASKLYTKNGAGINYVEARAFLTDLGYVVGFNDAKKRVMVDNRLTLDIPTIIENGKSFIHLRECIDFLNKYDTWKYKQDKTITYNNTTRVIVIS